MNRTCFMIALTIVILSTTLTPHAVRAGDPKMKLPDAKDLPVQKKLPDPFTMLDGSKVQSKADWNDKRRPELKRLFQQYVYGWMPEGVAIEAKVTKTVADVIPGKASLEEIEIRFPAVEARANEAKSPLPRIHLALFYPTESKGPSPVFLALNKCGNHTVVKHQGVTIDPDAWRHKGCGDDPEKQRGEKADFWNVEYLIDRGYAFATFHESDVDPDRHDFSDGIHPHFNDDDLPGPHNARWGTIAAWSWGLRRCVDYLVTAPEIDGNRVAIIGHSRRGKTALLAAAFDERVALVVPHQSGTGGMALSRNNDQETVERINRVFPHWFNDVFTEFNDNEEHLPVDQHLLVALVAPRAVLDTAGLQDTWANYNSGLKNIEAADKVYKFLDAPGVRGAATAGPDDDLSSDRFGNLLQYRLNTKHTLNRDYWKAILDYADRVMPPKSGVLSKTCEA